MTDSKTSRRRALSPLSRLLSTTSIVGIVLCSFLLSASATTLLKLDLETLTSKSETIVQGTVSDIEFVKVDGRIYTYITLAVEDVLKGDRAQKSVEFRVLGGKMGDLITIVHGTPEFSKDEEVLVFLERPLADKPLVVTGMVQGKFHVTRGPDDRTLYVVPNINGTPLVKRLELKDKQGQLGASIQETEPDELHTQVIELDALKSRIQELEASN